MNNYNEMIGEMVSTDGGDYTIEAHVHDDGCCDQSINLYVGRAADGHCDLIASDNASMWLVGDADDAERNRDQWKSITERCDVAPIIAEVRKIDAALADWLGARYQEATTALVIVKRAERTQNENKTAFEDKKMKQYLSELMNVMKIDGETASVRYSDLDWNATLLDLVDWNEMASNEADSILTEAFGRLPDKEILQCYFDTYWCETVQRMWPAIPGDGDDEITIEVVRDSDGDIDEIGTADKLYDAVKKYAEENTHLTDDQREAEIASLRKTYPDLIEGDASDND